MPLDGWGVRLCRRSVNEITQLTPSGFGIEEGFDYIGLDATATKTSDYRKVPLHEHLLDQGCSITSRAARIVRCSMNQALARRRRKAFPKGGERLAGWVRHTVGVADKDVQPELRLGVTASRRWRARSTCTST